jgi:cytochrome P450
MVDTAGEPAPATERLDDSFFQDPQGLFTRLRSSAPVTPVITTEGLRVWLVTRYEDVRAALADPRLAKDWVTHMTPEDFDINVDPVQAYLDQHMLNLDPPDHTRLRRLVVKAFTPRRVAALRPRISAVTDELLDAMADGPAETDLIESFALPLGGTFMCELIGNPVGDRE